MYWDLGDAVEERDRKKRKRDMFIPHRKRLIPPSHLPSISRLFLLPVQGVKSDCTLLY